MHKDRLFELRDLLIEDANTPTGAKFDLGMWVAPSKADPSNPWSRSFEPEVLGLPPMLELGQIAGTSSYIPDDRRPPITTLPPMSCGTTGCALGLALISGRFAKYGLTGTYALGTIGVNIMPMCNGEDGFDAGAELFAISNEDSRYLFDPDCYDGTPKGAEGERLVAQRIDDFVNGIIDKGQHPDHLDDDADGWDDEEDDEEEDDIEA